jgi:hypothetical protein
MQSRGVEPAYTFEPDRWWPRGDTDDDLPSPSAAQHWIRDISGKRGQLVLDVERWSLRGTDAAAREAMRRYITLVDWIRNAGYSGPIGYYGVIPIWDHERALQGETSPGRQAWRSENDRVQPLADRVDILFPSLYTQDGDMPVWERFATANLREARRLAHGRPVYAFLWPQYHGSNKILGLQYLPGTQWARELEVVSANADGAVIWGGVAASRQSGPPKWDDSAEWWQATSAFIAKHGTCLRPAIR